jgi:hypothetical protein
MKVSCRKLVLKNSSVWSDEYFGSNNRTARGKRHTGDKSVIRNANRKIRYDKSWKEAA